MIITYAPRASPTGLYPSRAAGSSPAACSLERAHVCEEPDARLEAFEEIGEMDLFVRPVDAIIGQTEAHQHNGDLECVLDQVHNRDRAAIAKKDHRRAESLLVGSRRYNYRWMGPVNQRWLGAHERANAHL
jgi:hypothetical protein